MKGRVVFQLHLKPRREQDFLQAYEAIRDEVAQGVEGHISTRSAGRSTIRRPG